MDPAHPQAGERERGILLPTASADIPYVVFTAHVQVPLALVSSSQLFKQAEFERGRASKAQLSRLGDMFQHGTEVGFQPVNIEGRTVATSIQYTCKPTEVVLRDFGVVSVKDFVVINPVGRLLFSSLYHFVGCPPELCDPLLADVVYEAKLLIRVDLEGCAGDPSKLPNAKLTAIVQELWVPTEEEVTTFDLAPWRTCSIVRYLGDDFDPGVLPQPRSTLPGIHLLYLGANRALYIDRPRYKVLIPKPGGLKPGRELKAAAFWSSRNDAYIVYDFGLKGRDVSMMPAFIELNPFADELQCEETRFHVRVRQANAFKSPAFRGFYMAVKERKPTEALLSEKLLIEDPLHLLIDQQLPTGGLRVGIRPNKDYNRVAKFSISRVVDEAGGKLSRPKRRGDLTIATGSGFLANRVTGSVYCSQFPLVPLYLPVPDRSQLRVGEQITFKAAYCDEKRIYVIIQWQRAVEVESQTFEPYRDGHLFIETLKETRLGCSDRCCLGENFGLITDRDEVILTYAKRNKVGMPKDVPVRVRENRDPNRSTFFDVHSVEQMEEFEEQFTPLPSLIDSTRLKEIGEIHAQLVKLLDEDEGATKTDSK